VCGEAMISRFIPRSHNFCCLGRYAYLVGSCVCLATGGRIVVESSVVVEGNLFGP
jgi:hypothetical protein